MAIYHNTVKSVCPSKGSSVVASSSYITGEKRIDERTGEIYDYTRKGGVVHSEVLLYENAPSEYANGKNLWNAVSKVEGQNGRTAKAPEMSLPRELSREEQIQLAREAVQEFYVKDGRCAEFAIHDKGDGNPHVHVLVTTRPIDKNGQWEHKTEKVYICKNHAGKEMEFTGEEFKQVKGDGWEKQKPYYEGGNPKKKPVHLTDYEKEHNYKWKEYQRVKGKNDPLKTKEDRNNPLCDKWNSPENLNQWREFWAQKVNRELERKNIPDRVDHRSLKDQGIQREPQIHIGPNIAAIEKKGVFMQNDRGEMNRKIIDLNEARKRLRKDAGELYEDVKKYNAEVIQFKAQKKEQPKQLAAQISEPTRLPIVQNPQPKPLEPVRMEADNGISTVSIDGWKKEITQAREAETVKAKQPQQPFQEIKTDYDQARTDWGRQQETIDKIESQLRSENYKLEKFKDLERRIGEDEEKLGKLSRFNPFKRSEIKDLEQRKESLIKAKQTNFVETRREHIEQLITQLNQKRQSEKNKMPELNTRYKQTKDAFDQRLTELKLDKSKDLLERYKAGEKISDKDKQLINSFSKELGIQKIQSKNLEQPGRQR